MSTRRTGVLFADGIALGVEATDAGKWDGWIIVSTDGRASRGGFATKAEAFAWIETSFANWREAR